jgi:putative intracellular protease/amidase
LHHWIKTQQRDFGRSKALKCPQCSARYETEGFNSLTLRLLDITNHLMAHSGRVVTAVCAGTIVLSFGAGERSAPIDCGI